MQSTIDATLIDAVRESAYPLTGAAQDYDPLMDLVGDAHAGRASPEHQQLLLPHRHPRHLHRRHRGGQGDRPGALHVVVEDPVAVAVPAQVDHFLHSRPERHGYAG